ncbi:MAG: MBL fold metallo-hydrolase [Parcubacteria group bacterium]|nr:MBL fold metallo-hydrolase [Parcubacteria group bacterium]
MSNPKLTFYGGVGFTTGANFLVEYKDLKLLVDCGLLQGTRNADEVNSAPFKYNPSEIQFLFVTHAHMDHIGKIPKLVKDGFKGQIISTFETKELAKHLLVDAYKIMISRERGGVSRNFYEEKNIGESLSLWESVAYGEKQQINSEVSFRFLDAGHILGSAIIELNFNGKKVVFTGDLGNSPSPLLRDTEIPEDVDYLIIESVYGDRNHKDKEERREMFKKIIKETLERKGEVIIPAFSVDRTQIILYELNNMVEDGELPSVPVFLDSPLAEKVTAIYSKSDRLFNQNIQKEIASGDDIFSFPKLDIVGSARESQAIENIPNPKIIIAGSGMSEGGRVLEHEARALPHPENTILLMGYQPVGTLGRELQDGAKTVTLPASYVKGKGGKQKVPVRARIESVHGYSAHKDSEHLLEFVEKSAGVNEENQKTKLKKVFVVMGEPKSSLFLVQRIRDYLDIPAIYPEEGKEYELI